MAGAERRMAAGDDDAGMDFATAIGDWSQLGGYELEGQWDAACRRIVRSDFAALAERPAATLSGGERKRLVLDVLFASDADVLLLDEPDNFLDVAAKRALEQQIATSKKTVLVISHDRELLSGAVSWILTVEGDGTWMHDGSYATLPAGPRGASAQARRRGQALERRGASPARARADLQGARPLLAGLGEEGRRRRDALAALRRRGPAARARSPTSRSRSASAAPIRPARRSC